MAAGTSEPTKNKLHWKGLSFCDQRKKPLSELETELKSSSVVKKKRNQAHNVSPPEHIFSISRQGSRYIGGFSSPLINDLS